MLRALREVGAIRSDAVERAFATVARHRCIPRFRYGPDTITVPLIRAWSTLGQPSLTQFTCTFRHAGIAGAALWVPRQWALDAVAARD